MVTAPPVRGFLGSFWVFRGKDGRSDWIRTSDPYPPRIATTAKLLIYRAARSRLFALRAIIVHPFLGITQKPHWGETHE